MRYVIVLLLFALCAGCGDWGGRGDTDLDCDSSKQWEVDRCPESMACNLNTNKCSTAKCTTNDDCYCGESREGRYADAPFLFCACSMLKGKGGTLPFGFCVRKPPPGT